MLAFYLPGRDGRDCTYLNIRFVSALKGTIVSWAFVDHSFESSTYAMYLCNCWGICHWFGGVGLFFIVDLFVLLEKWTKITPFMLLAILSISLLPFFLARPRFVRWGFSFRYDLFLVRWIFLNILCSWWGVLPRHRLNGHIKPVLLFFALWRGAGVIHLCSLIGCLLNYISNLP